MLNVKQLNDKPDDQCDNIEWYKRCNCYLTYLTKLTPALIFFFTIFGSMQLYFFCADYNIPFIMVVKTEVIFTYGVFVILWVCLLIVFPLVVIYLSYVCGKYVYKNLMLNSRLEIVINNPKKSLALFYLILSLWPFVLLSKTEGLLSVSLICLITLSFLYVAFMTQKRNKNLPGGIINFLKHTFINTGLFVAPVLSEILSLLFIISIEKQHIRNISGLLLSVICLLFFVCTFFPAYVSIKKDRRKDAKDIYLFLGLGSFIYLCFAFNGLVVDKVARAVGLGYSKQCVFKKELDEVNIPADFYEKTSSNRIVQLNVVAKIDDVYYLSRAGEDILKAEFSFKSDKLRTISCTYKDESYYEQVLDKK